MKMRKIPMRTCVITKEKLPKSELIRVVRTPLGEVVVDATGKANGRGAYLKKDLEKGVITLGEAKEIIDELFLRFEERLYNMDMWVEAIVAGGTDRC